MAAKLLRFTTILMVPALALGLWLWWGYGVGQGAAWMHAKLAVVALVLAYHHQCARQLRWLRAGTSEHGHIWYRWFNELPVLLLVVAVVLVVVKPF
jgi:putative membrane protein